MSRKTLIFGNGLGMASTLDIFPLLTLWQLCGPPLLHFLTFRRL